MRHLAHALCISLSAALVSLPAAAQNVSQQFQSWLQNDLWPDARTRGISEATFNAALGKVKPMLDLPDLVMPGETAKPPRIQHQAEFGAPANYFAEKIVSGVTAGGRSRAGQLKSALASIEQRFGVPGGILLAVWGRESGFGRANIPHNAFAVLSTKAFMARRKEMFRKEVLAALEMVQRGHVAAAEMKSSWAGALGQPQFLPTSYLQHAYDADGDGRADIWTSQVDTLASIANYLANHGWVKGRDWGFEVTVPDNISCALEGPDRGMRIADWAKMGVKRANGRPFPDHEARQDGFLLMPAGRSGPAFIVTPNFYVLKAYNESDLYALFVGHSADRITYGDRAFAASWSPTERMLRADIAAMQRSLEKQGYDVGGADGLPGFRTRRSIGEWQAKDGRKPTCFPDTRIINALK